jgi:hypothetical protein
LIKHAEKTAGKRLWDCTIILTPELKWRTSCLSLCTEKHTFRADFLLFFAGTRLALIERPNPIQQKECTQEW